jgi:hypothetical protein
MHVGGSIITTVEASPENIHDESMRVLAGVLKFMMVLVPQKLKGGGSLMAMRW